jgi:hypothetical protein
MWVSRKALGYFPAPWHFLYFFPESILYPIVSMN